MKLIRDYIKSNRAENFVLDTGKGSILLDPTVYNDYIRFVFYKDIPKWYKASVPKDKVLSALKIRYYSNKKIQNRLSKGLSEEEYQVFEYYIDNINDNLVYIVLCLPSNKVRFKFNEQELTNLQTELLLNYLNNSALYDALRYVRPNKSILKYADALVYLMEKLNARRFYSLNAMESLRELCNVFSLKDQNGHFDWKLYELLSNNINIKQRVKDITKI